MIQLIFITIATSFVALAQAGGAYGPGIALNIIRAPNTGSGLGKSRLGSTLGGGLAGTGRPSLMTPLIVRAGSGLGGGLGNSIAASSKYAQLNNAALSANNINIPAGGLIPVAKQIKYNLEFREMPTTGANIQAATVEVGASAIPINIIFRSASSSLNVLQQHQGAMGDTQESSSEDEPHRLVHTVTKPVIQEIHEVISPYRKITQEVQPVQEEIQTIVARNSNGNKQSVGGGSGGATIVKPAPPPLPPQPQPGVSFDVNDSDLLPKVFGPDVDAKSISAGLDQSLSKQVAVVLQSSPSKNAKF